MFKKQNLLVASIAAIAMVVTLLILGGFIGYEYCDQEWEDSMPKNVTYAELQELLSKEATLIYSIAFEMHDEYSDITLPTYDSRNYCMIIYDDFGKEIVHTWLCDVIVAQDGSLEDSYFIPAEDDLYVLKTSEDLFVSQLSKEHFRNLNEEQIDFILTYLFRNV